MTFAPGLSGLSGAVGVVRSYSEVVHGCALSARPRPPYHFLVTYLHGYMLGNSRQRLIVGTVDRYVALYQEMY